MALYGLLALLALPIVLAGAWAVTRALLGVCVRRRVLVFWCLRARACVGASVCGHFSG